MQPLGMTWQEKQAYRTRLYGSHDYRIRVDLLHMGEVPVGVGEFIDGQVNLHSGASVRRTATIQLSDIEGAWDFAGESQWGDSKWTNRLVRIRHTITVPGQGEVTTTPFIGPVSAITRTGSEVTVECQDKSSLGLRGTKPYSVRKGQNAVRAIRQLLQDTTGEFRFRLPSRRRRLSRSYNVGWDDEAAPWLVASRIARQQLGMQLLMSCDGYVTLRQVPSGPTWTIPQHAVTGLPTASVDYTDMVNYVRVVGAQRSRTKGDFTTTTQPEAVVRIRPGQPYAPEKLSRKGVPRFWPEVVEDSELTTVAAVRERAQEVLTDSSKLLDRPGITCVPVFHLDADDITQVETPEGTVEMRIGDASIPLGVGGDMTIGTRRNLLSRQSRRTRGRVDRSMSYEGKLPRRRRREGSGKWGRF